MSYQLNGCPDCKGFAFVEKKREGDTVCIECGLVLQERNIEDNTFYNPNFYEDHEEVFQEEQRNYDAENKMKQFAIYLQLPDSITNDSIHLFRKIREIQHFRGNVLNAVLACSLYIVCNTTQLRGFTRNSKEVYDRLGIKMQTFHTTLRSIYDMLPHLNNQMKVVKQTHSLMRQIRLSVPEEKWKVVVKMVEELDERRISLKALLGSPPSVVNAVLIYVACEKLKIPIDKLLYIEQMKISRPTLDKHSRLIHSLM